MSSTATSQTRLAPFVALQHRDFGLIWVGQLISLAGTQMQQVAINWHIYILTKSPVALGFIGLTRVIPLIVFSLIGGVIADAHDRRRVLIVTQSTMMFFAALLGILTMLEIINAPLIYALAALTAAASAFDAPARQALYPNLVPKEHLTNAISLVNLARQVASIVGPMLAGFVIAALNVEAVYWVNALSFLAVLAALVLMRTPAQQHLGEGRVSLDAMVEGIRFVFQAPMIRTTMLLDFLATFFSSATSLLPIFASEILNVGAQGLGLLYGAESIGAVIAGAVMSLIGNIKRQGAILLGAVAAYGAATALYGMSTIFIVSFVLLALVGAADTVSTILRNTIRQLATPDYLRGRMTSVTMIFFQGGPQLGNLEAGIVAALFGAPFAVISGGIATILLVLVTAWRVPELRNYSGQ
ncbi:MAG: MFS transporter [Anaerolineae bacterium]|nr:MFS transporter [Anaerolineae bacterium]